MAWSHIFPPAAKDDISLEFLGKIFGTVDDVMFIGSGSPLMGLLFESYNLVLLAIAVLVLVYQNIMMAVHQSTRAGMVSPDQMHRASGSMVLRTAIGVACLVPRSNGYTVLQTMVMFVATLGVGIADSMWHTALDYFDAGGSLLPASSVSGADFASIDAGGSALADDIEAITISNLFYMVGCVADKNQQALEASYDKPVASSTSQRGKQYSWYLNESGSHVYYGDITASTQNQDCGSVSLSSAPGIQAGAAVGSEEEALNRALKASYLDAVFGISSLLYDIAQQYARGGPVLPEHTRYITDARNAYIAYMRPAMVLLNEEANDTINKYRDRLYDQGWLYGGQYYNIYMRASDELTDLISQYILLPQPSSGYQQNPSYTKIALLLSHSHEGNSSSGPSGATGGAYKKLHWVASAFGITGMDNKFMQELQASIRDGQHPLLAVAKTGQDVLLHVDVVQSIAISFAFFGSLVSSIAQFVQPFGAAISTIAPVAAKYMSLGNGLRMAMGTMMGVWAPMIPVLVFTMAAMGWFFMCIEAMIAAPVVAMGMLVEEGHDWLGRSQPAIMILTNLALRPGMMLLGFFAATVLSYVMISLLNEGVSELMNEGLISFSMHGSITFGLVYAQLVVFSLQKCFDLVHLIPDRIMRWIGDTTQGGYGFESDIMDTAKAETASSASDLTAHSTQAMQAGEGLQGAYATAKYEREQMLQARRSSEGLEVGAEREQEPPQHPGQEPYAPGATPEGGPENPGGNNPS